MQLYEQILLLELPLGSVTQDKAILSKSSFFPVEQGYSLCFLPYGVCINLEETTQKLKQFWSMKIKHFRKLYPVAVFPN